MNEVIYVAHCLHSGAELQYNYLKSFGSDFHALPNLYAISLIEKSADAKIVSATVIAKTDFGQSKEEIGKIYSACVRTIAGISHLPLKNFTLASIKINLPAGHVPSVGELKKMFMLAYTTNSSSGNA